MYISAVRVSNICKLNSQIKQRVVSPKQHLLWITAPLTCKLSPSYPQVPAAPTFNQAPNVILVFIIIVSRPLI